jgi:hypothetical protein
MRIKVFGVLALGAAFVIPTSAAAAATPATPGTPVLVASGFDSPRGVAFFHGRLVVAEAGSGGRNCTVATPTDPVVVCFGRTGRISWANPGGTPTPLVDNLFSVAEYHGPIGFVPPDTLGPHGLSAQGGTLMAILGVYPQTFKNYTCPAGDQQCQADLAAAKKQAGALLAVKANGSYRKVAGVGAYDYEWTVRTNIPDQEQDANPYGVLAANGGVYVADAGSNTLDFVSKGGRISVVNYFPGRYPAFPSDEVPSCVVRSGDSLWVGTLAGNLFQINGGSMTRVVNPLLKHVTGCAADREQNIYLVNMWTNPGLPTPRSGNIVQFNTETGASAAIAGGLNFPNMDTVGPDGNLYFSANSVCPAAGEPPACPKVGQVWKLARAQADDGDGGGD